MSSMNVSRHVRFGLRHLLHPPSGVQSITRLAGFGCLELLLLRLLMQNNDLGQMPTMKEQIQ